mgnify:FL=1|tara:strand:+ start:117 stop:359 length:243 start_codon:yes stop_codon:yes gene_type:complete
MSQNELDSKLDEFIQRLRTIEGEIQLLNEDKKELFDEYKDVFEPKVIREAVRAVKARMKLGDSVTQLDQIIDKLQDKLTV